MRDSSGPTIVLTGSGSGGHITPLLAIASEIKRVQPEARIVYIGQKGDKLADIPSQDKNINEVFFVRAGKFRRFHGEGYKQLLDIPTFILNARDFFYVIAGLVQSYSLLKKLKPDILFVKGGFIGVPVGLAAAKLHIPYITHDSDAIPGLANRIIARGAAKHAVALPAEVYDYPSDKTVTTGIPLQAGFKPVNKTIQNGYKSDIGIPEAAKILFVIGGGLGAQKVNSAVAEALPHLLSEFSDLYVVQSAGRANEAELKQFYEDNLGQSQQSRVKVFGYLQDVYRYSGAADLIVTRAGATNLAEFALQGKACVVIPNPVLASGHQLKNAKYLAERNAAAIINQDDLLADSNRLTKQLSGLLHSEAERNKLAQNLSEFAKPSATKDIAELILNLANKPA